MKIVIGLGNPGKKFERTRHNIGFTVVDEFSRKNNFPEFKLTKKFLAEFSEGEIAGEKVILAKPQTFMNLSGKAVKLLNSKFKNRAPHQILMGGEDEKENGVLFAFQNSKLFVVHDDIDLPLGKIRISVGRSSAGHKGVESIIRELKTKDFVRFRIGIKPKKIENRKQKIEDFVLKKFNKEEEKILKKVIEKTAEAIETAIKQGAEKAMNKYNK